MDSIKKRVQVKSDKIARFDIQAAFSNLYKNDTGEVDLEL